MLSVARQVIPPLRLKGLFLGPFVFLMLSSNLTGQSLKAKILVPGSSDAIRVQVELSEAVQSWSFRNAYAGAIGLGDRVQDFGCLAQTGQKVSVRNIASGEFRADERVKDFSYTVGLNPANHASNPANISWLAGDYGLLMLADVLPQFLDAHKLENQEVQVELDLPVGWTSFSASYATDKNRYRSREPENSVFMIGRDVQGRFKRVEGIDIGIATARAMPFKDAEILAVASRVFKKYLALTQHRLESSCVIMLAPFPFSQTAQWKAETRGSSVVIVLNPQAEPEGWVGQLGVIFTHELLHLWVPNSLRLKGDYDWFFEGFTLYEALLTALDLKLISFAEYLNTLARVYDSYLSHSDSLSLLEASERRWTSSGSFVYDKGMLVAFMYDLMVRQESGGKTSLADLYPALFSVAAESSNANDVIMKLLGSSQATQGFAKSYIEGRQPISLEKVLPTYGLQLDSQGSDSRLFVNKEMTSAQRTILRSLGYKR
jgi:hypothetical protein